MQISQTYNHNKQDHINRASIAQKCAQYFNIKNVSPSLFLIASPVSELAHQNKNGKNIRHREEIIDAIPWNERSMKTFGVVYRYESTASFIGLDGKTYIVPNDEPVINHLKECGYTIAESGKNLDGTSNDNDTLYLKEKDENDILNYNIIDRRLPKELVDLIEEMEKDRPYYNYAQSYANVVRFGGTLGIQTASEEELRQLSLSERKVANILTYGRVLTSQNLESYIEFALQQYYLNEQNFPNTNKL